MKTIKLSLYILVFCFSSVTVFAENIEDIINKHIEAHGGKANWDAVKSMKITGRFTAFSVEKDFMTIKAKPNFFYSEFALGKAEATEAYNGEYAWTHNLWFELEHPRKATKAETDVIVQKAEFCTPFLNYKEKKYTAEFLGKEKLEGVDVLKIKLVKENNQEEIWYLDAKTYLEYKSEGTWADFGRSVPSEVYYSDFQKVGDVIMTFNIDRSFPTRHRMLQIEKVELNIEIDETKFYLPKRKEIQKLNFLEGKWDVKLEVLYRDGNYYEIDSTTSCIKFNKVNGLLTESISYDRQYPMDREMNFTYNSTNKKYRVTLYNSFNGNINVYEGDFVDNVLSLDNLNISYGSEEEIIRHGRIEIKDITENGFLMELARTEDKGETWMVRDKFTYKKKK